MPDFEVLHVTPETAPLLDRVAEDVFDDAITPASAAAFLAAPGHALLVALADGVVIGQARGIVHAQPDGPPQLYIDNLGVAPASQRRGAATALVRALKAWGLAQGCVSCWVATETDNAEGLGFYESLGMTRKTLAWFEAELSSAKD